MKQSARSPSLVSQPLHMLKKALPAAQEGNPEALHQARVASRRMREALPLVAPGGKRRKLKRGARRITRVLGPVRELDVALQMLDELAAPGDMSRQAIAKLRQAVAAERDVRRKEMIHRLERCDVDKLTRRAAAAARKSGAAQPSRKDLAADLARARRRAAGRAEDLRAAIDKASGIYLPDRLHQVRIAVKKLRYAMELVRELSRSRATARLETLKQAQDLLGRMHDLEMLIARTRAVQGSAGGPSLKVSADLDRLVRAMENECRQLHGRYIVSREALLKICDAAVADAARSRAADAA